MPPTMVDVASSERESPTRRALYWCVLVMLPVMLLAGAEGALRVVGYGSAYRLFEAVPGYPDYRTPNADVGGLYFADRPPTILADYFPAEVDEEDLRIVVQGGSTAAGYPYYYGGSFPHILENALRRQLPSRRVDVVNTGMAAVNSYTLLDLAPQIADEHPDAVLIYAGHNEYFGALGVSSTEGVPGGRTLVHIYLRVMRLRLAQLLRDGAAAVAEVWTNGDEAERMEALARHQSIPEGSAVYLDGLEQFRANLTDLLAFYGARDIPVFVSTVASNIHEQSPFVDGASPDIDSTIWRTRLRALEDPSRAAEPGEPRLSEIYRLIELDSTSAEVRYHLAQLLEVRGDLDGARREYIRAKDLDQLRFRAPEAINAIIRDVTSEYGATLVDAEARLAAASPNGLIGSELMVDHVHPSPEGYRVIAEAFSAALFESGLVVGQVGSDVTRSGPPEDPRMETSLAEHRVSSDDVVLTEVDSLVGSYHAEALKSRWPFTLINERAGRSEGSETHGEWRAEDGRDADSAHPREEGGEMSSPSSRIETLARALFRREVTWEQANRALFAHHVRLGHYDRALRTARSRMQEFPFLAEPYLMAAAVHVRLGSTDRALDLLKKANTLSESVATHRMLARTYSLIGDAVRARQHAARAGELHSDRR